jgi:hypothetical protein
MTAPDPEPLAAWLIPHSRAPREVDLTITRGVRWDFDFPPTELPLTGAILKSQIRDTYYPVGRVLAELTLALDEDGRTIHAHLTGEQTGKMPIGQAVYDVKGWAGTIIVSPFGGRVTVAPDVTR